MTYQTYLAGDVPTISGITPEELNEFELIDVRTAEELVGELGHIAGVKHYQLGPDLMAYLQGKAPTKKVLMICRSGARSAQATLLAGQFGWKEVYNLQGGMIDWNNRGLPIETK